jgi:hypothetical protein
MHLGDIHNYLASFEFFWAVRKNVVFHRAPKVRVIDASLKVLEGSRIAQVDRRRKNTAVERDCVGMGVFAFARG